MGTPIRLLLVEDSEDDALLLLRELQQGGFDPSWERIDTEEAMRAALSRGPWDMVIADFTMPGFSGTEALTLLRARDLDSPFIFVSGTIGEDVAVNAMKAGAHDYIMKGNLRRLVPAIERELREAEMRREHHRVAARMQHLAFYDSLTELPNRALLQDRLQQGLAAAERTGQPLAFMILDLDGFKEINDTLGHRVGDLLLQQVGQRIREALRGVDTVARLGGDEFAVLLSDVDPATACLITQRVVEAVARPFQSDTLSLDVRASVGLALYPDHGVTSDLLMQRADVAMYVAKESKAGFVVYSPEIDRHTRQRLVLTSELRGAIQTQQLVQLYQPKVRLTDEHVLGLEVLTHWRHATQGLLPPARFIALAEQTGLIGSLTLATIDVALRTCRGWRTAGHDVVVAVNVSPRVLRNERFPDEVAVLIEASSLTPPCLEIEITENIMIADPAQALAVLSRLSAMGIRISIDDFGTGYSSLSRLRKLPVGEIKIDRSFISDLALDGDDTIVRSTIDLAHNLGLTAVAEGVETQAIWDRLVDLRCDAAQGYVSPPLPLDAMTAWLSDTERASPQRNSSSRTDRPIS